jgi:Ca2+-binding RTX toxin-like protein
VSSISEQYFGDAGNDFIVGIGGDDLLDGGSGNDNLTGGGGADRLVGGDGFDAARDDSAGAGVSVNDAAPSLKAGDAAGDTYSGIEALIGSAFNDTLVSATGVVYILSGRGNDTVHVGRTGSSETFTVDGGIGDDDISGVGGVNNLLRGGDGNDVLSGVFGTFSLQGGAGDDSLTLGSFGHGTLDGGDGNDTLSGNAQRDVFVMHGGNGNDRLQAVGNFSTIAEQYFGDAGNDVIVAIGGNDLLDGGSGDDSLNGGGGADQLRGGAGNDAFVLKRGEANGDAIADFRGNGTALGDSLVFQGYGTAAQGATFVHLTGNQWQINSSDGSVHDVITLANGAIPVSSDYSFA